MFRCMHSFVYTPIRNSNFRSSKYRVCVSSLYYNNEITFAKSRTQKADTYLDEVEGCISFNYEPEYKLCIERERGNEMLIFIETDLECQFLWCSSNCISHHNNKVSRITAIWCHDYNYLSQLYLQTNIFLIFLF